MPTPKEVIHRDLQPGNFLLTTDGRLVLADFGIARMIQESDSTFRAALTSTGMLLGTPEYMAPEMLNGEAIDHRADIYALGIVLFQMLSGHVPFKGNTPFAVATKHLQEPAPSLHQMRPALPLAVDGVIQKALAKKREDRFTSAGALRTAATNPGYLSETQERNAPTVISPPRAIPPPVDQTVNAHAETPAPTSLRGEPSSGGTLFRGPTQPVTPYPASVNRLQPWLIFIGILLVLVLVIGGVLVGLQLNKGTNGTALSVGTVIATNTPHSTTPTVGTQSTATSLATSGSTPTAGVTQKPNGYQNIVGSYGGSIYNAYAKISSTMTLSINQNLGSISGKFTVALPLQGTGPFTGSFDTSNTFQFIVVSQDTNAPILFNGIVQTDGSLSGSYCSVNQTDHCDTNFGGYGKWMATRQ